MSAIEPSALAELLKAENPPKLLDVRQPEEHAICALPDAKLVPLNDIPQRLGELEDWKDEHVVVYCHHGMRSAHAIGWLRTQGFEKLTNLTGGIDLWAGQVDPDMQRY